MLDFKTILISFIIIILGIYFLRNNVEQFTHNNIFNYLRYNIKCVKKVNLEEVLSLQGHKALPKNIIQESKLYDDKVRKLSLKVFHLMTKNDLAVRNNVNQYRETVEATRRYLWQCKNKIL